VTPAGAATGRSSGATTREDPSGPRRTREITNPHRNEAGSDAAVRRRGRAFILSFYGALRAIKLYPIENAAVIKALEDLTAITKGLLQQERDLEFRTGGEFIFINATRLRLDLDKVKDWMTKGAQPSDRVMRFLDAAGIAKREKRNNPEKAIPRKERKARAEAAKAGGAAAPAA